MSLEEESYNRVDEKNLFPENHMKNGLKKAVKNYLNYGHLI